ncbi:MAG: hypothetical protein E7339_06245 [Clostridiales bacterium]|nr:hypothetical protein [Clostridiales bacterium]
MVDKLSKTLFCGIYPKLKEGKKLFPLSEIENEFASLVDKSRIRPILLNLEREGLVEVTFADRKGEGYVYINLLKKGMDFHNQKRIKTKEFFMRVLFAVLSALITFICGKLLYGIFV